MENCSYIINNVLPALGCGIFLLAICYFTGNRVISLMRFSPESGLERFLIAQAAGSGVLAYSVFFLGLLGAVRIDVFVVIYVIVLPLLLFPDIRESCMRMWYKPRTGGLIPGFLKEKTFLFKIAAVVFLAFILSNMINAMIPPIGRDALKYHLALPGAYIDTGRILPDPGNFFSYFPQLTEMLYTLGLMLSNDLIAHIIHLYFGVLTALAVFAVVRELADARAAIFAALVFYSMPVVSCLSNWAYVDLTLCFFTVLSVSLFIRAMTGGEAKDLIMSGILTGFSLSIKYPAAISLYILIIIFFVTLLREKKPAGLVKKMGLYLIAVILIGAPWYLRNLSVTGNPVYPMFYNIFGGSGWDMHRAAMYDMLLRSYGMGNSFKDLLLVPWRLAVYSGPEVAFDGRIGIMYMIFAPFLLWFRPKDRFSGYMFLYCVCFFVVWISLSQQARFLLPALACFSICLYPLFTGIPRWKRTGNVFCSVCIVIAMFNLAVPVKQVLNGRALDIMAGKISREGFLSDNLRNYRSIKKINDTLPDRSRTYFVLIGNIGYYCEKPFIQESVFEDYSYKKIILEAGSPKDIDDWFHKQHITHILIDEYLAGKYTYPSIPQEQLDIYQEFKQEHLELLHRDGTVCLYKIV